MCKVILVAVILSYVAIILARPQVDYDHNPSFYAAKDKDRNKEAPAQIETFEQGQDETGWHFNYSTSDGQTRNERGQVNLTPPNGTKLEVDGGYGYSDGKFKYDYKYQTGVKGNTYEFKMTKV